MTWRDQLRRVTLRDGRQLIGASFRGVPFFVESADLSGGRRTVTHEFPFRDDPFVRDLGRRARTWRIEGYVIGDDYLAQRDALLAALEDVAGPGELVHPYYGVNQAICTDLSVRETLRDGGMAVISVTLARTAATPPAPIDVPDLPELVDVAATEAVAAAAAELVETYDVEGQPAWALESLQAEVEALAAGLEAELAPVAETAQEAARLSQEIRILTAQASSLIREPADLVAQVVAAIRALAESAEAAPRALLQALLDAYETLGETVLAPSTTATRIQERANQLALVAALRRILVVEAARLAPLVSYETLDEAQADADAIAELLEEQAADADTAAYPALVNLRSQLRRAVPGDAVLARLIAVERRVAVPSLVLAYQLYGSVDREQDVVARNRIRHPGFVAGELEVLSDG